MARDLSILTAAIRTVEALRRRSPEQALDILVTQHGAVVRFANGTEELRLAGALGTCTSGGSGLVDSWLRAANRKLQRENA